MSSCHEGTLSKMNYHYVDGIYHKEKNQLDYKKTYCIIISFTSISTTLSVRGEPISWHNGNLQERYLARALYQKLGYR